MHTKIYTDGLIKMCKHGRYLETGNDNNIHAKFLETESKVADITTL